MRSLIIAMVLSGTLLGIGCWQSGSFGHTAAIHAALMITAWGMMMPAGGVVARYYKVTAGQDFPAELDNQFWWVWHRTFQYGGLGLATVALGLILTQTDHHGATLHARCGALVMVLGWLQVMATLMRGSKGGPTDALADRRDPATWRGDHFDMTRRRVIFEAWHKPAGWGAIVLAGLTILLGIDLVGAPSWLLVVAGMLQGAAGLAMLDGVLRGRWFDTHVAIWGPREPWSGMRTKPAEVGPAT